MNRTDQYRQLSHAELLRRFADLVTEDRRCTAQLLLAIAEIDSRKLWASAGTRSGNHSTPTRSRAIPAAVRREIWQRDLGRCTWRDADGNRCRGTRNIEYHHETP